MKIRSGVFENKVLVKIDESVTGTTYVGKAPLGSATSASVWQILKMVESAGVTTVTWAGGDSAYDNVWDNRAALSYS